MSVLRKSVFFWPRESSAHPHICCLTTLQISSEVLNTISNRIFILWLKKKKSMSPFPTQWKIPEAGPCSPLNPLFLFGRSVMSDSLWSHCLQHTRLPCPSLSPRACSDSCPLSRWCHPTVSSSVLPFSSTFHLSQHQGLFQWVISSYQVTKVLELQLQHQSLQWKFRVDFLVPLPFHIYFQIVFSISTK